jgi:hypothetical protein
MENPHIQHLNYETGTEKIKVLQEALNLSKKIRHEAFLEEIALFIFQQTGSKYVLIGQLSDDFKHIHTLIFMRDGEVLDNLNYALKGTPCEQALVNHFYYHPYDITEVYPDDEELTELNIESYLGNILLSEDQEPIGLIVLMDVKQINDVAFSDRLIKILTPAIEEEVTLLKTYI